MLFIIVRWVSSTLVEQPVKIAAPITSNAITNQRAQGLSKAGRSIWGCFVGKRQFCMASRIIKVLILAFYRRL
jgi:hypothetical protein